MTNIDRLFTNPSFWHGAIATRNALLLSEPDDLLLHSGLFRASVIETKLRDRQILANIPEFHQWLRGDRGVSVYFPAETLTPRG